MRRLLLTIAVLSIALTASAVRAKDGRRSARVACKTRNVWSVAPAPVLTGDHKAIIILADFADMAFQPGARGVWDDIANKSGYAEHGAVGCVADYFTVQSSGRFNLSFDVVGPVQLPEPYAYYGKDVSGIEGNDRNVAQMIRDACQAADEQVDFAQYDWDGDGRLEMVFVLYAGMGQNDAGDADTVWPEMSTIPSLTLDGVTISTYACCNEIAGDGVSLSGLGTFCHEFSHCLGLPDLYESVGTPVLDEWDLMDGGCYANGGWTPVNYSAYEKYLCGWLMPEELTAPTTVRDLPALADEDRAYLIRSDSRSDEFYILENRQWTYFDSYLPGHGLLVTHVTGHRNRWGAYPNTSQRHPIDLVFADNLPYLKSESSVDASGIGRYAADGRSNYLACAAYPFEANDSLTALSTPANTFGKPVTAIREENGLVSFDFMGGDPTAILPVVSEADVIAVNDLQGRSYPLSILYETCTGRLLVIRFSDGSTKKVIR